MLTSEDGYVDTGAVVDAMRDDAAAKSAPPPGWVFFGTPDGFGDWRDPFGRLHPIGENGIDATPWVGWEPLRFPLAAPTMYPPRPPLAPFVTAPLYAGPKPLLADGATMETATAVPPLADSGALPVAAVAAENGTRAAGSAPADIPAASPAPPSVARVADTAQLGATRATVTPASASRAVWWVVALVGAAVLAYVIYRRTRRAA